MLYVCLVFYKSAVEKKNEKCFLFYLFVLEAFKGLF